MFLLKLQLFIIIINLKGYNLWITMDNRKLNGISSLCGGEFRELDSTILSPNYPNEYDSNLKCIWTISVPQSRRIILIFNHFETEKYHDYVEVFDGLLRDNIVLGNFSGSTQPNNLISGKNLMTIKFSTDSTENRNGFSASFWTVDISYRYNKLKAIFNTPYLIFKHNFETNKGWRIYTGTKSFKSIAYNNKGKYLSWIDSKNNEICIKNIKTSGDNVIQDKRICVSDDGKADFLSIDWIHDLLYWIDMETFQIKVLNVKKPHFKFILLNITKKDPRDLIINAKLSKLVWIIIGDNPEIMQSNQDGSQQSVLYNTPKQAIHLTIDYQNDYYYFISLSDYTLYSIDFNGNNEKSYLKSSSIFSRAYTINVLNDNLFLFIDNALIRLPKISLNISRADIIVKSPDFNHSQNYLYLDTVHHYSFSHEIYWGKIIDPLLQPSFPNKCQHSKCSHICLPSDNTLGYSCVCPINYLQINQSYCKIIETKRFDLNENISRIIDDRFQKFDNSVDKKLKLNSQTSEDLLQNLFQKFNQTIDEKLKLNELSIKTILNKTLHKNIESNYETYKQQTFKINKTFYEAMNSNHNLNKDILQKPEKILDNMISKNTEVIDENIKKVRLAVYILVLCMIFIIITMIAMLLRNCVKIKNIENVFLSKIGPRIHYTNIISETENIDNDVIEEPRYLKIYDEIPTNSNN